MSTGAKKKRTKSKKKRKPALWETAPLSTPPQTFTSKPPSLTQRDVDFLLAGRSVDFSGLNLEALDLSFADLSGSAWYGASLARTTLSNARLRGVDAGYGMLKVERARFDTTAMVGTLCRFTLFEDCLFINPNVSQARFENTRMTGCQLQNTTMYAVTVDNAGLAPTTKAWFEIRGYGVTFDGCTFKKLTLASSFFHRARFANTSLQNCRIDRVHFPTQLAPLSAENLALLECEVDQLWCLESTWTGLRIERSNLVLPKFDGSHLQGTFLQSKFEGGSAVGAKLDGSTITKCTFGTKIVPTDLSRVSFDGVTFNNVLFLNCRLTGASWNGVDHSQISFRDCIDAPR